MLKVIFKCIDGEYKLVVDKNNFFIETDIKDFNNKEGIINNQFIELIKKCEIEKWNNNYLNDLNIEDGVKWYVEYNNKNIEGIEGSWPYNFEYLIEALIVLDEQAKYFKYQ